MRVNMRINYEDPQYMYGYVWLKRGCGLKVEVVVEVVRLVERSSGGEVRES